MANIFNRKFIKVKDCHEYDIIYATKYHYCDKGRKKRVKQAINRRFRRTQKQNEKNNT